MRLFTFDWWGYAHSGVDFGGAELRLGFRQAGASPADTTGVIDAAAKARLADAFGAFRDAFLRDSGPYAAYAGLAQRQAAEASRLPGLRQQEDDIQAEIRHQLAQDGDPLALERRLDTLRSEITRVESRAVTLAALRDEARAPAEQAWHAAVREFTAGLRRDIQAGADARRAELVATVNAQAEGLLTALSANLLAQGQLPVSTAFPMA